MEENKPPLIKFLGFQKDIYIEINSINRICDYYTQFFIEMSEEEKLENGYTPENHEGFLTAIDFIKSRIQEESQRFAVELELDGLGLGDSKTKSFGLGEPLK